MDPLSLATSAAVRIDGDCVVKELRSSRARDQEARALTTWGALLTRVDVPRLLPARPEDGACTLRLERLPGRPLADAPRWRDRLDVAEHLGAGLAELHALPCAFDPLPLPDALSRRMEGWLRRDAGSLSRELRRAIERAFDPSPLARTARTPTHRDVHAANVLVHRDRLALLDWEHARPDCPWFDVVRTWEGDPPDQDPWTRVLATTAGLDPAGDFASLRAVGFLEGVGSMVWGAQHAQPARVARGLSLLERLLRS